MGEVFVVGIRDQPQRLVAERELGVAEEGLVGGGDEPSGHLQDSLGGSSLDACRQFLGLRFEFGRQRLGHEDLLPE